MKMNRLLIILTTIGLLSTCVQTAIAKPFNDDVVSSFIRTLVTKGEEEARSYVDSDVDIPEIRENTPIRGVSGLPSPKGNVRVSVAYFDDGKNAPDRMAFIWEVTYKKNKITDIRVVYDGSNPFMNELNIIKAYKKKFSKNILGLSSFPFDITHVDGEIKGEVANIQYKNNEKNGIINLKVEPKDKELDMYKDVGSKLYFLKNGEKALCLRDSSHNYKLIFQYDELQYTIDIEGIVTQPNDLIYVANSMFLP